MVIETVYPGAHQTTLDNGLRILIEEAPQSLSVSVGIWLNVGSRDDDPKAPGMAHLIEHLLFKGTHTRDAVQISREIDSVGGYLNAATAKETTFYYADVPADGLSTAVELLVDLVRNPSFEADKIELERSVVLEEIRGHKDDPEQSAYDHFVDALWKDGHPLTKMILGTAESITHVDRETIRAYHQGHYRPENMVLVASGAVDPQQLVDQVAELFASAPESDPSVPRTGGSLRQAPVFNPGVSHHVQETGQTHMYLALPGVSASDPGRYALEVVNAVLGDGTSSRLFQSIREERGLAYNVGSMLTRYTDAGVWLTYAAVAPRAAKEVVDLASNELRRLRSEPLPDDEVALARARLRGSFVLSLESNANRAMRLGSAAVGNREILSPRDVLARLDSVTDEDLEEAIRTFVNFDAMKLVTVGPNV